MDWEQLREKTLGEVGTSLVAEGAGVTAGFIGAAIVGRQIQNRVKSDTAVEADPTATNKIMAWSANNVPKIALWYLLKKYTTVEPGEVLTPMKEATVDAKKAVSGSIIYDTIIRLANGGRNPGDVRLWGYSVMSPEPHKSAQSPVQSTSQADIQRLIQENSALRAELNKALQRLAQPPLPAPAPPVAQPAPQVAAPPPVQMAPVVQTQPQRVYQQAPPPVIRYQPVPQVAAQPQVFQQAPPPVIRYQQAPPMVSYTPVQQPAPVRAAAQPIVQVEQRPPMVRAEEITPVPYSPGQPFAPYVAQPIPPAVQERERKYGFMDSVTPPVVQERQKKYGFMAGGEKDVAAMFGML